MKSAFLQPQINTVGLVGHWKLWDGTAFDYSLNGSLGTLQADVAYKFPGAAFDGTGDYIDIDAQSQIDITAAPLSIFAWIYPIGQGIIISKNLNSGATVQYHIYWNGGINTIVCDLEGGAGQVNSVIGSVTANKWYLAGTTWDGTNYKCFINGVQSGSTATYGGSLTSRANCSIGRNVDSDYFEGSIGDVMIFNTTKTAEEAKSMYEVTRGRYGV